MRLMILLAWSLSGVILAASLGPRATCRLAWTPVAVILGPMWAFVAVDQRRLNRDHH